jgi:serine protease Do
MFKRLVCRALPALLVAGLCLALLSPARAADQTSAAKPFLGVLVAPVKDAAQTGALIHEVTPDSPAAKAGLKNGDVITRVGDKEVKGPEAVVEAVQGHKPGDKLKVTFLREGKEQTAEVTLGEHRLPHRLPMPERRRGAFLGVLSQELTPELKKQLNVSVDKGAVVMQVLPESPAARAGLHKDDVITAVNDQAVGNPEELRAAIQKLEPGKETTLKVNRGGETKEIKVQLQPAKFGFGVPFDFDKDFPMLKDGKFPFEKFPSFDKDVEKLFEELHKRIEEMQKKGTDRTL